MGKTPHPPPPLPRHVFVGGAAPLGPLPGPPPASGHRRVPASVDAEAMDVFGRRYRAWDNRPSVPQPAPANCGHPRDVAAAGRVAYVAILSTVVGSALALSVPALPAAIVSAGVVAVLEWLTARPRAPRRAPTSNPGTR